MLILISNTYEDYNEKTNVCITESEAERFILISHLGAQRDQYNKKHLTLAAKKYV